VNLCITTNTEFIGCIKSFDTFVHFKC